jgi:hypothetical protein
LSLVYINDRNKFLGTGLNLLTAAASRQLPGVREWKAMIAFGLATQWTVLESGFSSFWNTCNISKQKGEEFHYFQSLSLEDAHGNAQNYNFQRAKPAEERPKASWM